MRCSIDDPELGSREVTYLVCTERRESEHSFLSGENCIAFAFTFPYSRLFLGTTKLDIKFRIVTCDLLKCFCTAFFQYGGIVIIEFI
jgi:hypothetical protein